MMNSVNIGQLFVFALASYIIVSRATIIVVSGLSLYLGKTPVVLHVSNQGLI